MLIDTIAIVTKKRSLVNVLSNLLVERTRHLRTLLKVATRQHKKVDQYPGNKNHTIILPDSIVPSFIRTPHFHPHIYDRIKTSLPIIHHRRKSIDHDLNRKTKAAWRRERLRGPGE